jgi:hypothetical protein
MNETAIKTKIIKFLDNTPGFWWRAGAGPYSRAGVCDIMGTYYGFTVGLEVKTPEAFRTADFGRSKNQRDFQNSINAAGGWATTVCSVSQVEDFLKLIREDLAVRFGEAYLVE